MTQFLCVADLLFSTVLWGAILVLGAQNSQKYRLTNKDEDGRPLVPKFASWPCLILLGLCASSVAAFVIDTSHGHITDANNPPFPLAEYVIMFNFSLDVLSMVPQICLIKNMEEDACTKYNLRFFPICTSV